MAEVIKVLFDKVLTCGLAGAGIGGGVVDVLVRIGSFVPLCPESHN